MLSKKAIARIQKAAPEQRARQMQVEWDMKWSKARTTQETNYIKRIKVQRSLREQALLVGNTQKARQFQVEIRYLQRKLDQLRGKQ